MRLSSVAGFGFTQGLGNQGQVWFYGDVDDPERPLSLAHAIGTPADEVSGAQFEFEPGCWSGVDAKGGTRVLRRVCSAQEAEPTHHSLDYGLSEGPP